MAFCPAVTSIASVCAELFKLGVDEDGIAGLRYASIIPLPGRRFEYARYMRGATGSRAAIIMAALDQSGVFIDTVAWGPETGGVAPIAGRPRCSEPKTFCALASALRSL